MQIGSAMVRTLENYLKLKLLETEIDRYNPLGIEPYISYCLIRVNNFVY